jgi:hypothetical protein
MKKLHGSQKNFFQCTQPRKHAICLSLAEKAITTHSLKNFTDTRGCNPTTYKNNKLMLTFSSRPPTVLFRSHRKYLDHGPNSSRNLRSNAFTSRTRLPSLDPRAQQRITFNQFFGRNPTRRRRLDHSQWWIRLLVQHFLGRK